ncbi:MULTISPECIES: ABC transporter ATP-binding protein [Bifidobacterium]|jgi:peptide/nickel transport system ATP-binding protein|uniref:ABC transporter ATP-binding protein n=1 Tax=Bifidobacterium tibiigranuli TaxID=2172043 RepID=A0A5N6S3T1_9BIFI|nr:ABC transporter ATP-binding protein [Bifidobacterium tibiigranuli]KAE8128474.1 ABC transporter ATP-binding protein [Bifidobacterium tibiigranuli]KAE8128509.1 peptide ABC transporter ATP-binding protein [Bifidobacterium tibiigranuli]MCI1210693.1 ABC transporter ATP-binding protein [Bifidobacterium tibiigranuli]
MSNLLEIDNLKVGFKNSSSQWTNAVDGVSIAVRPGEILGIVGESGCGKSVTMFSVLKLHDQRNTRYAGEIRFEDTELLTVPEKDMRQLRGKDIGFIFQNPMSSLNPLLTIGQQIRETVTSHRKHLPKKEVEALCIKALDDAGADDSAVWMSKYPYQLSGGMLQRVVIAIALVNEPKLLIADEPTTALDVTIQAQLLKVLCHIRDERGMSIVLITHDMGVVAETCDRVAVMYLGQIVETASVDELFANPRHPYTQGLLAATPPMVGKIPERLNTISGSVPQLSEVAKGCRFASRCPFASQECLSGDIPMFDVDEQHQSRCIKFNTIPDFRKVTA